MNDDDTTKTNMLLKDKDPASASSATSGSDAGGNSSMDSKRHFNLGTNPNAPTFLPSSGNQSQQNANYASRVVGKR